MLMQEYRASLERNCNLLARGLSIAWIEDGLSTDTALYRGRQVEEKGPRRTDGERGLRRKGEIIVVVICVSGQ